MDVVTGEPVRRGHHDYVQLGQRRMIAEPVQPRPAQAGAAIAEQSYEQVKDELGWADFQVRSDSAIRRHQALVNCAFCFAGTPGSLITRRSTMFQHRSRNPAAERGGQRAAVLRTAPS